jgi:beta-lactamase class A
LPARAADAVAELAALERTYRLALGVYARDIGSGATIAHRANERFLLCSTFKAIAAGAALARVDRGQDRLDRRLPLRATDLLRYAPASRKRVAAGFITLGDACAAAVEWSDNTAANLVLSTIGGPPGFTRFARSLGDRVTRLDRTEPGLNVPHAGDWDTTTPAAVAGSLSALLIGNALSPASRERLRTWMRRCQTGKTALRAGLPHDWIAGDKTGNGGRANGAGGNTNQNDIAVTWPPHRAPIVIAAYIGGSPLADSSPVLAAVGKIVASAL